MMSGRKSLTNSERRSGSPNFPLFTMVERLTSSRKTALEGCCMRYSLPMASCAALPRKAPQGSLESGLRPGSLEEGGSARAPRAATSTRRKPASPKVLLVLLPLLFMASMLLPARCEAGKGTMSG